MVAVIHELGGAILTKNDMPAKPGLGKRIFAWFMRSGDSVNRRLYANYKNDLFSHLNGIVIDLGAGTGLNLAFSPDNVTHWIAAEPNTAFHKDIFKEAKNHSFSVEITSIDAHNLQIPDSYVDSVVSTLVLCSVHEPERALSEIVRVMKPGATFVFIEHVVSESPGMRVAQNAFNPLNRVLADGCNCNRDTKSTIERSGLEIVRLDMVNVNGVTPFHKPHIMGLAKKPTS